MHRIQSGQVIVDLCSVVKELVENSLDAHATVVEVRFKNNGLDAIEVQDNGDGIAPENYESLALKHYTSKLSDYDDLSNVKTFGFRGEALSSLCALSTFYVTTAQVNQAPKGTRLDFETSGELKSTSTVASQKGTSAFVESLFEQLPVRKRELAKNIKREYGKVVTLLQAYACISTKVKFIVKNTMPKGKTTNVFSTNSNATTRENIANVYGAKTLGALTALDLSLELAPSVAQKQGMGDPTMISVHGHISRPVFGEGRQTPDRQMFFVNGRPCGLPQVAKAINDVYKSFNVSQSPFIFTDLQMDTDSYDVNVSPDKRSILLHNAADMIEKLKESLIELFDKQEQTIPQSQVQISKLSSFKPLSARHHDSMNKTQQSRRLENDDGKLPFSAEEESDEDDENDNRKLGLLREHFRAVASTRDDFEPEPRRIIADKVHKTRERYAEELAEQQDDELSSEEDEDFRDSGEHNQASDDAEPRGNTVLRVDAFNQGMRKQEQARASDAAHAPPVGTEITQNTVLSWEEPPNLVQTTFDRMRPRRLQPDAIEITIGDKTVTTPIGGHVRLDRSSKQAPHTSSATLVADKRKPASTQQFSQTLQRFQANGTQRGNSERSSSRGSDIGEDGLTSSPESAMERTEPDEDQGLSPRSESASQSKYDQAVSSDGQSPNHSDEERANDEARVAELIRVAEKSAPSPNKNSTTRANMILKSAGVRKSTKKLSTTVNIDLSTLETELQKLKESEASASAARAIHEDVTEKAENEEQRLSLTVSKADFKNMHIVGQFNLGFILAVRPATTEDDDHLRGHSTDELFIIDQHASDEKYNFERLQNETVVGNQRLVRPVNLELTAVEEEIVLENIDALEKNGFIVEADETGEAPVGQRIKLLSLPLSKEVTFEIRDLEELIHLLGEWPSGSASSTVPRPSKVRKMFAMRACRSSIMIGRTLSRRQMSGVLANMGTIDKPWNCPHGRPTMRHLTSLNVLETWKEGDGVKGMGMTPEVQDQEES